MGRRGLIEDEIIPQFIEEVKKRECIWNVEHDDYNDRYAAMMAWREIAKAMELPEELLKTKWKNMRDLFKREMKKYKNLESLENYRGRWRFFGMMWFVRKHRPTENFWENADGEESNDDAGDCTVNEEENPLRKIENVKFEQHDNDNNSSGHLEDVFVDVDPVPQTSRKRKREDDEEFDLMFLKSLLPYFKHLDPMRKLTVRSKIQDVLMNEIAMSRHSQNNS